MKKQFSAGIVVYCLSNDKPEYLLLHYLSGHWDFPKGKIESGEDKKEAALRELKEETGITDIYVHDDFLESLSYRFKDPAKVLIYKTVYFFVGRVAKKDISLSYEHKGFCWLPYPEADMRLTFKNARDLLRYADAFLKNLS